MSSHYKIFIVGLPGSGKTTLAKQVAEQLHISFIDLDTEIERLQSKRIEEIFKEKGESQFREIESRTLNSLSESRQSFVMATGGGAPCFHNNMERMKDAGAVIFLDVPPIEIANRISHQSPNRPLLQNLSGEALKDKIEFLRSQRIRFYSQAHHTLKGTAISPQDILSSPPVIKNVKG